MGAIIAVLGGLVTILYFISQLKKYQKEFNIDFSWLNFSQRARKKEWETKMNADPLFCMTNPMEATACMMYAMARCSGDISKEQKQCLREQFQTEFHLEEKKANELLTSCAFLVKDEDRILENLNEFMKPSHEKFDSEKKQSAIDLIKTVKDCEGDVTGKQTEFMQQIEEFFSEKKDPDNKW